jgi:hypothetical protein
MLPIDSDVDRPNINFSSATTNVYTNIASVGKEDIREYISDLWEGITSMIGINYQGIVIEGCRNYFEGVAGIYETTKKSDEPSKTTIGFQPVIDIKVMLNNSNRRVNFKLFTQTTTFTVTGKISEEDILRVVQYIIDININTFKLMDGQKNIQLLIQMVFNKSILQLTKTKRQIDWEELYSAITEYKDEDGDEIDLNITKDETTAIIKIDNIDFNSQVYTISNRIDYKWVQKSVCYNDTIVSALGSKKTKKTKDKCGSVKRRGVYIEIFLSTGKVNVITPNFAICEEICNILLNMLHIHQSPIFLPEINTVSKCKTRVKRNVITMRKNSLIMCN